MVLSRIYDQTAVLKGWTWKRVKESPQGPVGLYEEESGVTIGGDKKLEVRQGGGVPDRGTCVEALRCNRG